MRNTPPPPACTRAPLPWRGGVVVAGLALLLLAAALVWLAWQFEQLDPTIASGLRVAVFALPIGLASAAGVVGLLALYNRWARWRSVEADKTIAYKRAEVQIAPLATAYHYAPQISSTASTAPTLPLLDAALLTLPDTVLLSSVLPTLARGQLAYGMLPNDQPLLLPLAAGYHILSHGDTRSGKTNFLDGLMVQLHHQARHYTLQVICGDFKRELAATWSRSPLVQAVETDPATIAELIAEATHGPDGILDRYTQFEQLGAKTGRIVRNLSDWVKVTGQPPRLTFLVVDELNAVLEAADRKSNLSGALKIALQTGAGAGVYIAGGAQYLSSATFGRDGSKQFVTRCHFGAFDATAIRVMFGEKLPEGARPLLTGQPGRGLIRTAGQAQPTPFQALRCDEDDILGAMRLLTADQPAMPNLRATATIPATQQEPNNAAATATTGCQQAPDLPQIVARLRAQGMGKVKIIETLWGVKAGTNDRYKAASATYDQIVRD
jgi:DNA segregation ATPase FtsK/SpoIIIE-like protein